ncbi:AaceriAER183Cp [[Ashbya] aceris (nom. inval.)]|nr:AaceriAER183Cp [[Ashbya] aceris (nom. inval.)]
MSEAKTGTRKRVSKACDICRAKKIRCNGEEPCVNCEKFNLECAYTHVIKRRQAAPTRVSNRKLLGDLSARLQRLEHVLVQMSSQLGGETWRAPAAAAEAAEEEGESSEESEEDWTPCVRRTDSASSYESAASDSMLARLALSDSKPDTYFGTHTSFSLFSRRGLRWLYRVLGGRNEFVLPLLKLNTFIKHNHERFYDKFLAAVDVAALPEWPELERCELLRDVFLRDLQRTYSVVSREEVSAVFARLRFVSPGQLSIPEQLLVCTVMLLAAIAIGFEQDADTTLWDKLANQMLTRTVNIVQTTWMMPTSDPVGYMQAIILLCVYLENSPVPQTTYLQLSFAIRIGQTLGLHQRESYMHIKDVAERYRRLNVWWWCYRYDKVLSVCTGKPSLIHEHDNTAFNDWDYYQLLKSQMTPQDALESRPSPPAGFDLPEALEKLLIFGAETLTNLNHTLNYHLYKLYRIQSEAYTNLFCNRAMSEDDVQQRVRHINYILQCLDGWWDSVPEMLRAREEATQLEAIYAQLSAMRREDEDPQLVNHIFSRVMLLYLNYYWTRSGAVRTLFHTPLSRLQPSDAAKTILRELPGFENSFKNSVSMLKLVDYMLARDADRLHIEPLFAYLGGFLSLVSLSFFLERFSHDNIMLLDRCCKAAIARARHGTSTATWKWTIVSLITTHFLKLAVDRYNELRPDHTRPLPTDQYATTLRELQLVLVGNYKKIYAFLDNFERETRESAALLHQQDDPLRQPLDDWFNLDLGAQDLDPISDSLLSTLSMPAPEPDQQLPADPLAYADQNPPLDSYFVNDYTFSMPGFFGQ